MPAYGGETTAAEGRPSAGPHEARRFVGRAAQLAMVTGMLASERPHASFAVVEGDPGIGKSRLLAELADWASGHGTAVLTGRTAEQGVSHPFELLLDVLAGAEDASSSGADGGGRPAPVGRASGGMLLERLASAEHAALTGGVLGVERHRLYRAVRDSLTAAAGRRRLLVLLDDVHAADEASLELLDYLVRHPPKANVVVVLAARTGRLPTRLRGSLSRLRDDVARVMLAPLSAAEVDELTTAESPNRRRWLYEASCGNPLYLEILSAGESRPVWELGRSPAIVDDRVAVAIDDMIRAELRALPSDQRLVAAAAAVAGDNFDPAYVAHVADLPPARTDAATDALVARDVLRSAGAQLVFRHPLVRAAAYGLAGPAWRLAAHGRAAAYLAGLGEPPSRQAPHLEQAFRPGDVAAAKVLAAAAEQVLDTAPSASTHWLYAALRALPDRPDTLDRRHQLWLLLARALTVCGRLAESKEILHRLVAVASRHRCPALELLAANERLLGRLPEARAILLGELARANGESVGHEDAAGPGAQAGPDTTAGTCDDVAVRLELAATEILDGGLADAEVHATAVLERCGRDPARRGAAAAASTLLTLVRVQAGRHAAAGAQLAHAQWAVDGLDDAELRGMLDLVSPLAWTELMAERYDDAMRHLDRGVRVARRFGRNHVVPEMYLVRSVVHGRVGRVTEALRDAEDAEEIAMAVGGRELHRFATTMRLRPLLWHSGPARAAAVLTGIRRAPSLRSSWWRASASAAIAEVALDLGDLQLCRSVLPDAGNAELPASVGPAAVRLRARAELMSGNLSASRDLVDRARELAHAGGLHGEMSATALVEAELLAAGDRLDDAIGAGVSAVSGAQTAGLPVREGQARVLLAELYHRGSEPAAGREHLGIAKALFQRSGADWLAGQATNAQRRLGAGQPRRRACGPGVATLSGREREIAQMVAQGLTNQAIADRLFLSRRTVEAHIARIFAKVGVSSRVALARLYGTPPS
ncbi:hypothetical protein GCM10012284_43680 [Mangrovihabitans endophyticus]|uniref:HTH luxR-type domain-containing protein n=2 Tax=Mangrovihabitans endophyticus TaxID=1751298 RepID=A0A8J3C3F7_9ACTN|nr:hypothetical protein GCM10012284_43680 [Mangrovihabitans endophyticus]